MEPIENDQIRILDLLPGEAGDPIRCRIRVANLQDQPQYEALSSVWVDQLCINQDGYQEKSAQVRLMRRIYSECKLAVLWLGDIRDDTMLTVAKSVVSYFGFLAATSASESSTGTGPGDLGLDKFPTVETPTSNEGFRAALQAIIPSQCSWWNRIWTVQEAALPQSASFLWGPFTIAWHWMSQPSYTWNEGNMDQLPIPPCINEDSVINLGVLEILAAVQDIEFARRKFNVVAESYHVTSFRHRNATDPRDKVYALSGLIPVGKLPRTSRCDYGLTVQQVYVAATMDFIEDTDGLCVLDMDPRVEDSIATPGLPRWALDLSATTGYDSTSTWVVKRYYHYFANRGLALDVWSSYEGKSLALKGVLVDRIKIAGPSIPGQGWVQDGLLAKTIRECYALFATGVCKDARPKDEDFGRLLLGDIMRNSNFAWERRANSQDLSSVSDYIATGLIGLGHLEVQPGDEVWILNMGQVPFTLRKRNEARGSLLEYEFVGGAYVQGVMHGEWYEEQTPKPVEQTVYLY
ncbi:heterokaryon incompatibility protein [Seiridium cupressi]